MKYISAFFVLLFSTVALAAPADKTLRVPIYETGSASFIGRPFTVSGNNGKVLGITSGDWALVSPLFGTSPTITTSILTDSTTFGLFNTTATTINAFGAATTLNVGANAATVLNFGGAGTAAQFRFIEPGGSNYTGFKAQAQAANVTYTLPAADGSTGQVLSTNGSGALSWISGGTGGLTGSAGGNGAADSGLAALFDAAGSLTATTELTVKNASTAAHAYMADDGTIGFHAAGETNPRELVFPDDVLENEAKEIATRPWVLANAGGGSLTATYVGYGDGSNALTGEAAFNYTAASDLLTVPNITVSGTATLGTLDITTLNATALQIGGVGITSTAAELNYTDGVTSAIQTQLDAKVSSTSPAITTSITTPSTTFALANTTATTVNAFGAATTLNIGASAATVLNLGGSTSSAELRFLEPSGSGTNYTGLKAQAQAGNVTYTLPAADGTNGQVMATNGSGVLSWATASGLPSSPTFGDQIMSDGTSGFNGNLASVIEMKEEFFMQGTAVINGWAVTGTLNSSVAHGDANHWGVIRLRAASGATNDMALYTAIEHINLGSGTAFMEWIIKTPVNSGGTAAVSDGTDTYTMVVGLGDTSSSAAQVDGCFFRYTHSVNSGNWERVTRSNTSNEEAGDTGIAFAGGTWYRLGMKITNATSVEFFINGASVGTNSVGADIPNGAGRETGILCLCDHTVGTAERSMFLDAFRLVMKPTTPR